MCLPDRHLPLSPWSPKDGIRQVVPPCQEASRLSLWFGKLATKHISNVSWKALTDLHETVGKYGLGSPEVMQVLRVLNVDMLPPYDVQCLVHVLFRPVEYDIFESKWSQLAERAESQNVVADPQDPRHRAGADVLLGIGEFADVDRQVNFDRLLLQHCQKTGRVALTQTMEISAPKQSFAMVVQGADESFLRFAQRLTASVERQVDDFNSRMLLLKHLV